MPLNVREERRMFLCFVGRDHLLFLGSLAAAAAAALPPAPQRSVIAAATPLFYRMKMNKSEWKRSTAAATITTPLASLSAAGSP